MNRTRWLAATAATVMLVLGGGGALAAAGSSNPASDFLGDVAKRLGISQDRLEAAIQQETIARIDDAVAAGDLTKAEGDALKERVRSGGVPFALPSFGGPKIEVGPLGPPPPLMPHGTDPLEAAADYLGMDEADVREALRDGKSLADLAKEKGKSVEGLENAIRDQIRTDADEAVEDGVLSREQADRLVEKLSDAVDELVEKPGGFGVPVEKAIVPGFLPGSDLMETAAEYLGIDESDFPAALRDGKSLADLARDRGKSVDGLKQALVGAIRKDADQAVEDGVLTKEQADRIVEKLRGGVDKLVEGELRGGFGFRGGGDGYEFHFRVEPHRVPLPDAPGSSSPEPIVPLKPS